MEENSSSAIRQFALIVTPGFEEAALAELSYWWDRLSTAIGLEDRCPLEAEATDLGIIEFQSPLLFGLLLNHVLKIPTRILLRLTSFRCRDFPKLFNKIRKFEWEPYLASDQIEWEVAATRSRLAVEKRIKKTCQDALSAHFSQQKTPITADEADRQIVYIRMADDTCTVSIDTSGGFLFKRGIRTHVEDAPLRETIAAGLLWTAAPFSERSVSNKDLSFWDPMTGSGCIPLEAAGLLMPTSWLDFPFYRWPMIHATLADMGIKDASEARAKIKAIAEAPWFSKILGSDISDKAINSATANLNNFRKLYASEQLPEIEFFQANLLDLTASQPQISVDWCIMNPPYNQRLAISAADEDFYQNCVDEVAKNCSISLLGIVVPVNQAAKINLPSDFSQRLGLRFKNGGIPVEMVIFIK